MGKHERKSKHAKIHRILQKQDRRKQPIRKEQEEKEE